MLKQIAILAGLVALFLWAPAAAQADDPPGAKLFATYCAACHGANGQGGFATAVGSESYLKAHADAELTGLIADGTPKGMPAWSKARGGTLTNDQIGDVVAYLRSLVAPSIAAATPSAPVAPVSQQVFIQTKLGLTPAVNARGQAVLNASLTEYTGYPVIDAKVTFVRKTMFGDLDLGSAKTDNAGNASLLLSDVGENAEIVATFTGDKDLDPSQAKIDFKIAAAGAGALNPRTNPVFLSVDEPLLAPEGSLITPNPPLLPTTLFALVVVGIWSMYGYVVFQVVSIWRRRGKAGGPNVLRFGK